jgi:tRNA(fMet)-specific endonuclease VapC
VILDTNALSAFVDGEESVRAVIVKSPQPAIPVIVLGEFRYGIAQSRHRPEYEAWLGTHLPDFAILSVTEDTATVYASLRVELKRRGRPIPANDAWIAALALQHRLAVLSRDTHFDSVPDLVRESW